MASSQRLMSSLPAATEPAASLFLELPPEIRNMIYIDYLALYPELILTDHESSATIIARAPLLRVNKQIRSELTPMLRFYATHLIMRAKDNEIQKLVKTTTRFDKQTLAALHPSNNQPTDKPTQNQLVALQRADTLRPRRSPTLAASLRQFPALRVLVLEISTIGSSPIRATDAMLDTWMQRLKSINNVNYYRFTTLNLEVKWTKDSKMENVGMMVGRLLVAPTPRRWGFERLAHILGASTRWHADDQGEGTLVRGAA